MASRSIDITLRNRHATSALDRETTIQELVDTEVTYNTLLGLLIKHYVQPLSNYNLITNNQYNTLFSQIQQIKSLSNTFLQDLSQRRESWDPNKSTLSDLFNMFTPYFKLYQGYANNYEQSVSLCRKLNGNRKWKEYCINVRILCQRMDLASLLLLPIERLPKYQDLLSAIFQNTPPTHTDYENLQDALRETKRIITSIKSNIKAFERKQIVRNIERKFGGTVKLTAAHREFKFEGKLWKVGKSKDRLYHFFLFSDILVYASTYGRGYKFHNDLPINAAFSVKKIVDSKKYGIETAGKIFAIVSEKKSFIVYADTIIAANQWMQKIGKCIQDQAAKSFSKRYKTDATPAGIWVPNAHTNNCSVCDDKFSFVNRKHHCRRCGNIVCNKCSKWKLPNGESVMQRACNKCYFRIGLEPQANIPLSQQTDIKMDNNNNNNSDDDEDDFEDENAALHSIPYYVDNADIEIEDIFNKFGHGIGSYVLVPNDQDTSKNEYYTVTLVVYTQTGFESFNVSLFEKKGNIVYRLSSKKLKKKDFNDMNGLIAYVEKKKKLIFSYAIPRSEVENKKWTNKWDIQPTTTTISDNIQPTNNIQAIKGLENYPKAKALFDYEAEVAGDLTLRAGDIIYILDREEEDGWWTGMIGDRQGLFPSTFVEIIEDKPTSNKKFKWTLENEPNPGDTLIACYDFTEGGSEELQFFIGDKIIFQATDESGWWLGKLDKTGVVGWFAPDLVVPLDQNNTVKNNNNNNNNNKTPQKSQKTQKVINESKNDDNEPNIIISYENLKARQFGNVKVDKTKLEIYLSNQEFKQVFRMSRSEFAKKPGWKQRNIRKDKGLF